MTQNDLNELKTLLSNNKNDSNILHSKLNFLMNQSVITINNQQILDAKLNKIIKHLNIDSHSHSE
jgi:hypothetical protein